jgi:hypothetical protein
MIDGLKLTISGETLRTMLEKGIRKHEELVGWRRTNMSNRAALDSVSNVW